MAPQARGKFARFETEQPAGDGALYQPSVRLSLGDELRLLDEALEEARNRIRTSAEPKLLEAPPSPAAVETSEAPRDVTPQRPADAPVWLAAPEPARQIAEEAPPVQGPATDRTRILAALICILQQELVRDR